MFTPFTRSRFYQIPSKPVLPHATFFKAVVRVLILCSAISIMMADGVVSIGDGKPGNESSPSNKRRGSNTGTTTAPTAPVPASRVKRSPQGSATGESSTKGSERDEMEEVSNEEGQSPPSALALLAAVYVLPC